MKKQVSFLFLLMLSFVLMACKPKDNNKKEKITLTYAAWNLGDIEKPNLERKLLKAFTKEKENSHIEVKIIERSENEIDMPWYEFLSQQAEKGEFPDVFLVGDVALAQSYDWLYKLNDWVKNDVDFNRISKDITGSGRIDGQLLALPYAIHYDGFLINENVFKDKEVDVPSFGVEWDVFIEAIQSVANHQTGEIAGLDGINNLLDWYPAQLDKSLDWFTLDNEQVLHLDSYAFQATIEVLKTLNQSPDFVLDALSIEQIAEYFGDKNTWEEGKQAVRWGNSRELSTMLTRQKEGIIKEFDLAFIATPSVNDTQRLPIQIDYIAVSTTTKHPEAAYELAKWMSFGKTGQEARLDLVEDDDKLIFTHAPILPDSELLDRYFEFTEEVKGFRSAIEHGQYIVEPSKLVLGYNLARYGGPYNEQYTMREVWNQLIRGKMSLDELSSVNEQANAFLEDAQIS